MYKNLLYISIFRVLRGIAGGIITIAFPYIILKDFHKSIGYLGFIYALATISTAILSVLGGIIADVWHRKNAVIVMSALLPLSALLLYLEPSYIMAFLSAVLGGYSATGSLMSGGVGGAIMPAVNALATDIIPKEKRVFAYSIFTFLTGISGAFGAYLIRFIPNNKEAFLVAFWISLLGILFIIPIDSYHKKGRLDTLNSKKTIGQFSVVGFLNGFSQGLITPFLIPFFIIVYHIKKSDMAFWAFLAGILASISPLLANILYKHLGNLKSIILTRAVGAIIIFFMPLARNLYVDLILYSLYPSFRVLALPIQQSMMSEMIDISEIARAFSLNQISRLGASSIATMLTSLLWEFSFVSLPFYIYTSIMAINIGLYKKFFGNQAK
ncbi:MFS transporter [Hydrogenobaculum acidophilum]